jgi:hypothetical protein
VHDWLVDLPTTGKADGYRIRTEPSENVVLVVGNDARGVVFGVGRLLRELSLSRGSAQLLRSLRISSAPKMELRGHQLGYRPKTNSYDGWSIQDWEQYYRDLLVFGTNAVELIPPRSDDAADSPHFPAPPLQMMTDMSRLADEYGLGVWIWYPALDADYTNPKTVEFALMEWGNIFRKLPRIDAVFVPGGDPGHTRPKTLMDLLAKQVESLRKYHPTAQMWVSPQGFNQEWLNEFLEVVRKEPPWLTGVVYGPQVRIRLPELRTALPKRYPVRNYPDITHSLSCQYPVPDWDLAFALSQGREVINPRPFAQAAIFRACQNDTVGFITYSEGCNDDVNKFIWSGLGWDPEASVVDLLRQYSRYFIGEHHADAFAQGLLALERNWQGPLLTNTHVDTTLQRFQDLERAANPAQLRNWRFQQALYRAYFDAYIRDRLLTESVLETDALAKLEHAKTVGSLRAIEEARTTLAKASALAESSSRRARTFELAAALFQSIHMQLSVPRYKAISVGRGATQDTIDIPLNNRLWLEDRFTEVTSLEREEDRLRVINQIITRTDPGPGGFYDNLGAAALHPRLSRGYPYDVDSDFRRSSVIGFDYRRGWPLAWCRNAQSLYDMPLFLSYDQLDHNAKYRLRVVYSGDNFRVRVRLDADDHEIHALIAKPDPPRPLEFDIPVEATSDGVLTLRWRAEPGLGGNGRGCQVSEVWLMRAPP